MADVGIRALEQNASAVVARAVAGPGRRSVQKSSRCETPGAADVAHYVDTSALVRLVVAEPETPALGAWPAELDRAPTASELTRTELLRTV